MEAEKRTGYVIPTPDLACMFERAASREFREFVYSMAMAMPPDMREAFDVWHANNGGMVPWLKASGRYEAGVALEAAAREEERQRWAEAASKAYENRHLQENT